MKKQLRVGIFLLLLTKISFAQDEEESVEDNVPQLTAQETEACPDTGCKSKCISSLTQNDCPQGEFIVADGSTCGCCPGCRGGIDRPQEFCSPDVKCAPGLVCTDANECVLDKSTCAYTYHLSHLNSLPTCEIDGTFAAVQCKGDRVTGRCFCYTETGKRIYGWSWWREAHDMTCACSRLKNRMNQENTLHCDEKGNFEPLQCNDGVCWCADTRTGEVLNGTMAVPESMWQFLPCYDTAKMGPQYLRQCESAAHAQHLILKALEAHGTINVEFNNIRCDFDGAYGIYKIADGIASCLWRDGSKIGSFQAGSNLVSMMNCNCARDQKIFAEGGLLHTLKCSGNGNYESLQDINGKLFCVDRDGFAVTQPVETLVMPDCSKYLYYEARTFGAAPSDTDDDME